MSEDRLTRMLRSATDERPIPEAPIETLVHRGRRARRMRRSGAGALGTGAVALVVAAATIGGNLVPGDDGGRTITTGRGSDVTLAAATEATTRTTFHVKLTRTLTSRGRGETVETYQGAFDAPNRRGYLRGPGAAPMEQRFLGDERYVLRGKTWHKIDPSSTRDPLGPQELSANVLHMLRLLLVFDNSAPSRQTGDGPAAVQTYDFSSVGNPAGPLGGMRVSGSVTVGGAVPKIQKMVQTSVPSTDAGKAGRDLVRITSVIEFSDYGTPVNVTRPPL
ncbi:hypothetical protein [Actinomadura sp. WMMA1423]|uniref:hypothetical protein n=1 Tax=Actinomadura sp. WMMA1423 TaxID=2591108 RepID=UPI001146C7EE|nr:hypothetical protein [Actinomadura sp. WMMA1423]